MAWLSFKEEKDMPLALVLGTYYGNQDRIGQTCTNSSIALGREHVTWSSLHRMLVKTDTAAWGGFGKGMRKC